MIWRDSNGIYSTLSAGQITHIWTEVSYLIAKLTIRIMISLVRLD
jgi:hypothetical protein